MSRLLAVAWEICKFDFWREDKIFSEIFNSIAGIGLSTESNFETKIFFFWDCSSIVSCVSKVDVRIKKKQY